MERQNPQHDSLLDEKRELIDSVDREIINLISQRTEIALEIGRIKMQHNLPILAQSREDQVLEAVEKNNEDGPVPQEDMKRIFQAIMQASRAAQQKLHDDNES